MNRLSVTEKKEQKKQRIIKAALAEFIACGFAATTMQSIARRAGVAKGTLYLYYPDKNTLFQAAVHQAIDPLYHRIMEVLVDDGSCVKKQFATVVAEANKAWAEAQVAEVVRLIIGEGLAFPQLVEFYHNEVVTPILTAVTTLLKRAAAQGKLRNPQIMQYPQLVMGPIILGMVWAKIFGHITVQTSPSLMDVHIDSIFLDE